MTVYYVYVLRKPDGTPFYVGKGQNLRMFDHEKAALRRYNVNPHKERIIRKILARNEEVGYDVVAVFKNEKSAFEREIALIAELGRHNLGTGSLTNLTSGGDGVLGTLMTPEIKAKISVSLKNYFVAHPEAAELCRQKMNSRWKSEKFRQVMRESTIKLRTNPEFEEKRRRGHAKKLSDPAHLARVADLAPCAVG